MSLKIWYVSKYITPPGKGKVGGRGYLLMKELAMMGHKIALITSNSNHLAEPPKLEENYLTQEVHGMQLCWVSTINYSAAKSMRRLMSWIHFEWRLLWLPKKKLPTPDVIVVSSLSLLTIINGFWWRMRYKCRLVFEVRDIWPLTLTEEGGFSSANPFIWALGRIEYLGYRYADYIVGTMPNLGEHVKHILGYYKETHCIPMGIDITTCLSASSPSANFYDSYFPEEKFLVAHVGSIGTTNALETFFDCAKRMERNPEIHFLVIGDGDLRESFKEKFAHLSNLTFVPHLPKDMVQSVLRRCDLLYFAVHLSKVWKYGQSLNKIIDYMLAGKPIIGSYTGYPSMINEAGCGSFIPACDVDSLEQEIVRYHNMHESLRREIGERGRVWLIENRSYKKLALDYQYILNNQSGP